MRFSHEEPMMRSIPIEWNLFGEGPWDYSTNADFIYNFWVEGVNRSKTFESIYTVGMRGNGDRKFFSFFVVEVSMTSSSSPERWYKYSVAGKDRQRPTHDLDRRVQRDEC